MNNSENISTIVPSSSLINREELATRLREGNADVTFIKKDGTSRLMKCTLREGVAIPYEKKTDRVVERNDNNLPVWDLEAAAWRSINIDTIEDVIFYADC